MRRRSLFFDQNGSLDQIRQKLGLSRRKMCQLLLVDPSAWSRWTSPGHQAPPHIYKALDWYLSIMEKDPEYRRLAHRFADWMARERNHEGRIIRLEQNVVPSAQHWKARRVNVLTTLGRAIVQRLKRTPGALHKNV
ncbi:unnamed protein product [Sphagnum balticum]